MWYFTSDSDDRIIYIIPQAEPIIIGRSVDNQQCNFAIPNDPSISRKHATIFVKNNTLLLQDLGSRYGTFINNSTEKMEVNTDVQLNVNDTVKFGKMNSLWTVNTVTLNTCTSTLKGENLQKLKLMLLKIGGQLKFEWDDTCNYLTMPTITLTIKVVLALVQGSHIVTLEYWEKFLESVNNYAPMPDPQRFVPTVIESTLNKEVVSFLPDQRRKSLFKEKKFIFFSRRQYEMYKPVLIRSGASPLLLSECKYTMSMLCEQNIIVIQNPAAGSTQNNNFQKTQIDDIITHLKSKGKRVVADVDIGLAILFCSTDKYCNPSFSFTSEIVKRNEPLSKTIKVLAQESQETVNVRQDKENVKISETYPDDKNNMEINGEKPGIKRKLSDCTSELQFNPNKKVATACKSVDVPNESVKRRLSEDETSLNPTKKMTIEKENINQSPNSSEDICTDKSTEMFNFVNEAQGSTGNKTKKLNLSRPQKRKQDSDEGGLFNFVQTDDGHNESQGESSKQSLFASHKLKRDDNVNTSNFKSNVSITSEDISAMRGVKLKELMESNRMLATQEYSIKQECEDLEDKMNCLNLGNTIVTICSNLIVKKEPEDTLSFVKNFKKFKKVWPVKRQHALETTSTNKTVLNDPSNTYSVEF